MNGEKDSPPTGQEGSGSTDSEHTDSGVSRRHLLAGLAALGLLPVAANSADARLDDDRVDVTYEDHGGKRATIEPGSPIFGCAVGAIDDEQTEITVSGYSYVDEDQENHVEMRAQVGPTSMSFSCSTERARELAKELTAAADHADQEEH